MFADGMRGVEQLDLVGRNASTWPPLGTGERMTWSHLGALASIDTSFLSLRPGLFTLIFLLVRKAD